MKIAVLVLGALLGFCTCPPIKSDCNPGANCEGSLVNQDTTTTDTTDGTVSDSGTTTDTSTTDTTTKDNPRKGNGNNLKTAA